MNQLKGLKKTSYFVILFFISFSNAYSWTMNITFENGIVGEKVSEPSDAAGHTYYNDSIVNTGNRSAQLNIRKGTGGFGTWGGRQFFPKELSQGDQIWVRIRMYVPKSFDFKTNFALKFLRLHVKNSKGKHLGYTDIYIRNNQTLFYQNELYTTSGLSLDHRVGKFSDGEVIKGLSSGATAKIDSQKTDKLIIRSVSIRSGSFKRWETIVGQSSGAQARITKKSSNSVLNMPVNEPVVKGEWESFVYNVKYSTVAPHVRFYKLTGGTLDSKHRRIGGSYKLLLDDSSDYTLKDPTDKVDAFLLFTYWNGLAPKTQSLYVDDLWISTNPPPDLIQPNPPKLTAN